MTEIVLEKELTIKKSKPLYLLHVSVPTALVLCSTISMILQYFVFPTKSLQIEDIENNTTYNYTVSVSKQEEVIKFFNLDDDKSQRTIIHILQAFNVAFSILGIIYSKMMNNFNHEIGEKYVKTGTEKNTLLEQLTNITTSLSRPQSVNRDIILENFPNVQTSHLRVPSHIPSVSPSIVSPSDIETVLNTGRSNSTVYIKPYQHTTEPYN